MPDRLPPPHVLRVERPSALLHGRRERTRVRRRGLVVPHATCAGRRHQGPSRLLPTTHRRLLCRRRARSGERRWVLRRLDHVEDRGPVQRGPRQRRLVKILAQAVFEGIVYNSTALALPPPCRPTLEVDALPR